MKDFIAVALFTFVMCLATVDPTPSPSPTPFCHPCICATDPFGWEECHMLPTPKPTKSP